MTPSPNVAQPYHNNQDLNETESFLSELGYFHTSYTFTDLLVFEKKIFLSTFLCKSLTPNCGPTAPPPQAIIFWANLHLPYPCFALRPIFPELGSSNIGWLYTWWNKIYIIIYIFNPMQCFLRRPCQLSLSILNVHDHNKWNWHTAVHFCDAFIYKCDLFYWNTLKYILISQFCCNIMWELA